ncbi:MAG TPA: SDR family NAD(P)-dependent oxidoreductase [bacterium]|nr:SDR family NAD(P)-dependent oxidoreductase [bacterium]
MRPKGVGALVTGGASGLGSATAVALAAAGARVTILDLPSTRGPELAREVNGRFVDGDITRDADVRRAVEETAGLRVVVHCAGIAPSGRILSRDRPMPLEDFRRVVEVNLTGTFNVMRICAAAIARLEPTEGERGVIINTASVAAFEGQIGDIAYAASKAGVAGMTICAARDLASVLIRVVTIAPGRFDTPLVAAALSPEGRAKWADPVPHPRRLGDPREFASLAVHIVENPMLNGATIRLDGAFRMPPR